MVEVRKTQKVGGMPTGGRRDKEGMEKKLRLCCTDWQEGITKKQNRKAESTHEQHGKRIISTVKMSLLIYHLYPLPQHTLSILLCFCHMEYRARMSYT
jgi:hypothetical protein